MAAISLLDGDLIGTWEQPTEQQVDELSRQLPETFTGTLAWVGARPHVCVYRHGRLFADSLAPDASALSPLLQFAARPAPTHDLLTQTSQTLAEVPAPRVTAPLPTVAMANPDQIWQAAFEVYEKRLGRAARPAIEKLQKDLRGQEPEAVVAGIQQRLKQMFGAEAANTFAERLGGR